MVAMLLNRVLYRTDDERVRSDIGALAEPRTLQVEGASQDRSGIHQFRFWVDEPTAAWEMVLDSGARWSYSDGIVDYSHGESHPADFVASLPAQVRMLWPTEFLIWGIRPTHFRPVLIQHIGQRSLLLTFEHGADPAMRQTMVIDRTSGIATKRMEYDCGTVLTNIAPLDERTPTLSTAFEPVTDWIRPNY